MDVLVIAGPIVGIVVGWGLSQLGDVWRAKREDRNRFATTKRELYARFMVEATVIFEDTRSAAYAAQRSPTVPTGLVPRETADILVGARRKLRQTQIEIQLVAGRDEVISAAAGLRDIAAYAVAPLAASADPYTADGMWAELENSWETASLAFEKAARADLGV